MKKAVSPAVAVVVIIVVLVVVFAVYKLTLGKSKASGETPANGGARPEGADSVGVEFQGGGRTTAPANEDSGAGAVGTRP
jgi:hypothetical protein